MPNLNTPWATAAQLQVEVTFTGPRCTVRLGGELDLATITQLRDTLELVCAGRHQLVVVDLGGLAFLSLAGLQALFDAQQTLRAAGCRLVLANPDAITTRVLALTELDQSFCVMSEAVHPNVEAAPGGGPAVIA